ncbi:calcium-binding protein [Pseudonocardia phyllosphaerae]|uniref:calcium-binding protein n=1 Tax=Pseudonocardia phyllosphaerae TaxID=3390502 RepID=UPI00397931F8
MSARPLTRRLATVTASLAVTALAGLPFAAVASADTPDVDCDQISYEQAQSILAQDSSDPNRLDRDDDGIACEADQPGGTAQPADDTGTNDTGSGDTTTGDSGTGDTSSGDSGTGDTSSTGDTAADTGSGGGQVSEVPSGAVAAGDGSGADGAGVDPAAFLLAGTGAVVAVGAGTAVWSGRRAGRGRA